MSAERKMSKVAQAYERSKVGRQALRDTGARCMEVTEDKCGIVWERYILGSTGVSVVLFATPSWWDVFKPVTQDGSNDATVAAIKALVEPYTKVPA